MTFVDEMKKKLLSGGEISREEALRLYEEPLEDLCRAADEIRRRFCGNGFDLCTIINAKSGRCSEDCKFCAQSAFYETGVETYPLLGTEEILKAAEKDARAGSLRFSIVTSGKSPDEEELASLCETIWEIHKEVPIEICASVGILSEDQYRQLKRAGVTRVHNNLETSEAYFSRVCTTHGFEEKTAAIKAARAAGLSVCSGGIMGLGEPEEDRIDMALTLRELGVKSVPVNMLNPIPGTPLADRPQLTSGDMRRIVAVYRFLLPDAAIRLAGGRGLLEDKGRSCFQSGANAVISGDMLTTAGYSIETDLAMVKQLGYTPVLQL